jgi:hypothetical protein
VRVLVLAANLSELSIDLFIQFLDIIHRLIQVGREFIGGAGVATAGDTLQESLQKQCLAYFNAYHASRLDELKTHLENESWTLCPVKPTFSLRSLAEFAHLHQLGGGGGKLLTPSKKRSLMMQLSGGGARSYFTEFWEGGTPFDDSLLDASYEEDILMEYNNNNNSASRQAVLPEPQLFFSRIRKYCCLKAINENKLKIFYETNQHFFR